MAENIKFTDDELKAVEQIRLNYAEITQRFGQISLTEYNLNNQKKQAHKDFEAVRAEETKVLNGITEKYGPGTLDPNTGVFTPSDT